MVKRLERDDVLDAWCHDSSVNRMVLRLLEKINELTDEVNQLTKSRDGKA